MLRSAVEKRSLFTYEHYLNMPDEERREVVNGIPLAMTPSPGRRHQEIVGNIYEIIRALLKGKECKVYFAPFDLLLPESELYI